MPPPWGVPILFMNVLRVTYSVTVNIVNAAAAGTLSTWCPVIVVTVAVLYRHTIYSDCGIPIIDVKDTIFTIPVNRIAISLNGDGRGDMRQGCGQSNIT